MSKPLSRSNTYSGGQTSARDKTSYGIQRALPSPTDSLVQSTSNSASNSSSSPPEPATPPRANRSRTRYPDLGRVPLHRRGTSKTYERLEDLLKEAGYKETRVFTPETELIDANRHDGARDANPDKRLATMKEGMGAVVGFLAGLMPGGQAKEIPLPSSQDGPDLHNMFMPPAQEYSPPASPLASRTLQKQCSIDLTEPPTPTTMTSSNDSLGDSTPKAARQQASIYTPTITHPYTHPQYHQHHQQRPPFLHRTSSQLSSQQMHKQPSRSSLHPQAQLQGNANSEIIAPLPSRSAARLRHMASTQSMPLPRPNSTPTHQFSRSSLHIHDTDPENTGATRGTQPPLPTTWLETVARAVLFGGTGAHVGGPSNFLAVDPSDSIKGSSSKAKVQALRPTRSSLSQTSLRTDKQRRSRTTRSGLSDQTNTQGSSTRALAPPPHPLFSKVERGRAGRIEGEVSKARVVCRSAPGSRATSLVRSGPNKEEGKEKWVSLGHERGRNKRRGDEKNRVPSLARTQVEGDVWDQERRRRKGQKRISAGGSRGENRYLSGWGADAESEGDGTAAMEGTTSEEDDEEEDEGELDLARILVHPKRQHSIKSLRKHLSGLEAGTGGRKSATATARSGLGMNLGPGAAPVSAGVPKASGAPSILQRRPTQEDWDGESQEEWGGGWVRKGPGGRGSEDDEVERFTGFFGEGRADGSGRSHTGKSRLGFNGAWGLIGGGS